MTDSPLPTGLQTVLGAIVDRDFAARMTRVCLAAAYCIEQLQAINLLSLEPSVAEDGSADLALWERMAPAVADTVAAVSGLCAVIEAQFPRGVSPSGVFSTDPSDERTKAEASFVFQSVSRLLRARLAEVRDMVRRPELMASRWVLLEELQRLRASFRRRIGDAVYLSAAAAMPVRREEVVPGARQEVQRALLYRATSVDLIKQIRSRLARDEPLPALLEGLGSDLTVVASMPAWRHVHAGPKRHLLMVREFLRRPEVDRAAVEEAVGPLLETFSLVATELTREVLASHDLKLFTDALSRLEQAQLHLTLGSGAAGWVFESALAMVEQLRGRAEAIDDLLRRYRREPLDDSTDATVAHAIAELREALTSAV